MKKRNLIAICLVCLSFVGCQKFHTGKVVIDDKKNEEKVENVEYLVVDEEDKENHQRRDHLYQKFGFAITEGKISLDEIPVAMIMKERDKWNK